MMNQFTAFLLLICFGFSFLPKAGEGVGEGPAICHPKSNFKMNEDKLDTIIWEHQRCLSQYIKQTSMNDSVLLSTLNARFIKNFLSQDVKGHSEIIHPDFVCIESNGAIVSREVYLKNWATDFDTSGYTSFTYTDELIRIFGDIALVRSKTVYTKMVDGQELRGYTIYTDTYKKENGTWKCIQVQITPVK